MNLTNFLKQTDALTAKYSTGQLIAFIHDIARTFPEYCREDFFGKVKNGRRKCADLIRAKCCKRY